MTDDHYYISSKACRHAVSYLRKMRQWNEGKIDLTIEGCDPPYRMTDEEIKEETELFLKYIDIFDNLH